ncbi:DedA family protein [Cohnella endophytica]|uniref:DedA family protein n=1 Tax=Cohnella endophytica TaxID=2419778 RepID=A0A494Y6F4_9BACL|nr:DedA family protein [Cohnella endophytica]RKP56153.1 DedA family protein [Cohnella endophytica]
MEWMNHLFVQYGYIVLFIGLLLESLALPFPGELAMAFAGHLTALGHFNLAIAMVCAFLGATVGTTITYYLGKKLGKLFFEKYGKFIFLNANRLDKLTKWFARYGNKLLLVSYFIPGFRHFTGYFSGISGIRFRNFLIFNHLGALIWVSTYVMVGHVFSGQFEKAIHLISKYSMRFVFCMIVVSVLVLLLRKYKTVANSRKIMKKEVTVHERK